MYNNQLNRNKAATSMLSISLSLSLSHGCKGWYVPEVTICPVSFLLDVHFSIALTLAFAVDGNLPTNRVGGLSIITRARNASLDNCIQIITRW